MHSGKIIKKVPGSLPPPAKQENQGYIDDLSKKSVFELQELLERQNKLISNKAFTARLPDKGKKIVAFRDKILTQLKLKNEVDQAAQMISRLNIASEGKAAMNELEWTGKYNENKDGTTKVVELDSDDDDEDALKILAQPTGTGVHKKKIVHIPKEETLIKPEDLDEIESFKIENVLELEHVKYIVNKVEQTTETKRESFKPYKTTKSNVHDPVKEKQRKHNKNWEVTAATPPFILHDAVQTLSLNDSLKLQNQQAEKLQNIQAKHAAERLTEQLGLHTLGNLPEKAGKYRTHVNDIHDSASSSSSDDEYHEVHDDEDNDKRGTVVFTVDSIES